MKPTCAYNGKEALEKMSHVSYDIVIEFSWEAGEYSSLFELFCYKKAGKVTEMFNGQECLATYETSDVTGWLLVKITPLKSIAHSTRAITLIVVLVVIGTVAVEIVAAIALYHYLNQPIQQLVLAMRKFRKGKLSQRIRMKRKDEFGQLGSGFNDMATQIENLINSICEEQQKKKEIEMRFLQSQISPHFLYNTLNSIKSLARMNRTDDVCKMTTSLISLLRLISNGHEYISLEQEIQYVQSYISLMEFRQDRKIRLKLKLENEVLNCGILMFTLQPIVENCILHGFSQERRQDCTIMISAAKISEDAIEIVVEDNGIGFDASNNCITVPEWEIGTGNSVGEIYASHMEHVKKSYHLEPWETRKDVPEWAREISMVASIHCQHWTGYIFNSYKQVLENIRKLCEKIEPRRILAYLPGWEGRYYWKYGNYCPDERMGGEEGFRRLCQGARDLGVHLMPMFGINIVGSHYDNYEEWGRTSEFRSPSGNEYGGSVDWDGSRHYDHGSNRNLNPAAPKWQNRLFTQVTSLMDLYGFDAAFFDIAAVWMNDPNYYVYDGIRILTARLKAHNPQMLIAGEGWYDGLAACIPLLQCGHTDGVLHWHDDAYTPMLDTFTRNFGHLCQGDPSRFSTGVHEQGINPQWRVPVRRGIIPTLTIVDGTLEKAPDKVDQIIADSKEYCRRYL